MSKYRVYYTQVPVLGIYDKHLAHYGRMKKLLEAHQTKTALTSFRKNHRGSESTELSERV